MPGWPSTLRARLTLWYTLWLAVPLVSFAVFCYVIFSQTLESRTDRFIDEALTAFSREVVAERRMIGTTGNALRSAVKRADAKALGALGYGGKAQVALRDVRITPQRAKIGGDVTVSFVLTNKTRKPQRVLADLVVHFVKARGTGAKIFKLKAVALAARASVELRKKIGLRQLTTRKHYPGVHEVEAQLNGRRIPIGRFSLAR